MIKGTFKRNDSGRIVSFELTGHAQAGEYGKESIDWSAICSRRIQRLYPNQNNQRKLGGASHVDENEFAILRSQKRWRFYF